MNKTSSWLLAATFGALPCAASAQADPADPGAAAGALRHPSAFADYKPWREVRPADWRAVNDTVRDAAASGGQGGHVSPAPATGTAPSPVTAPAPAAAPSRQPAAPAAPSEAPRPPSAPAGHSGHGRHR